MESRYALREIEGAIGCDFRRLEDGRRAVFRHSGIHRRTRRDFFERRDVMTVLGASYMATSAFASSIRVEFKDAVESMSDRRSALVKSAFPYLDMRTEKKPSEKKYEDYSEYFDELDRIEAEERAKSGKDTDAGPGNPVQETQSPINDIIIQEK